MWTYRSIYLIGSKYNPDHIRIYSNDGLAVFRNTSDPQSEKIKKTFQKTFENKGLDIIKCNLKIVDYLDVTLNLMDPTVLTKNLMKKEIIYTCKFWLLPFILKQLPISIEKQFSSLSSSKEIFE